MCTLSPSVWNQKGNKMLLGEFSRNFEESIVKLCISRTLSQWELQLNLYCSSSNVMCYNNIIHTYVYTHTHTRTHMLTTTRECTRLRDYSSTQQDTEHGKWVYTVRLLGNPPVSEETTSPTKGTVFFFSPRHTCPTITRSQCSSHNI